jgi:hypothetical protein
MQIVRRDHGRASCDDEMDFTGQEVGVAGEMGVV